MQKLFVSVNSKKGLGRSVREFPEKVPVTVELINDIEESIAKEEGQKVSDIVVISWQWLDE